MLRHSLALSAHTYGWFRHAPTNLLIAAIRNNRRGLKWGVPAMLLAVPYLYAAAICTTIISHGGPGWLNLLVILCIWNAFKMLWLGPVTLVLLIRVRHQEAKERRAAEQSTGQAPADEDTYDDAIQAA